MSREQLIPLMIFEDELELKEEELLSSACRLVRRFPQQLDRDGNITGRLLGSLDLNVFKSACSEHKESEDEGPERTEERANEFYLLWSNVLRALFLEVEPGETDVAFEPYNVEALEALKNDLGIGLYRHVRKAFREVRVSVKYNIHLRPWNFLEAKEATLDHLLTALELR